MKYAAACAVLALSAASAMARESLGVFDGWGAFRDASPPRCFAIAVPLRSRGGAWTPFASVARWPANRIRAQVHFRLSREQRRGAPVTLALGDRKFALAGSGADAWAPDQRADAAIVAAMRSAQGMRVTSVSATGRQFSDIYLLKGAASAIDAAAIGCARR
jgi:hypothetical protein